MFTDFFQRLVEQGQKLDEEEATRRGITVAQLHAERLAKQKQAESLALEQRQIAERALADLRAAYGASLVLPVPAQPAQTIVLSGVSERSWGDGAFRRTVYHVQVFGEFQHGRLRRKSGQYLCTTKRPRFDIADMPFDTAITCQGCLERLKRFK